MEKRIYLDHSATTPLKREVLDAMLPYLTEQYGNPSSIYTEGREAKKALEKARDTIAAAIGAEAKELFFTASGTEADNWALRGILEANAQKGCHLITSKIEHPAILQTCADLSKKGCEITYLSVDQNGFIDLEELERAIREDTVLVSVMTANNEIGTIQPVAEIGRICKAHHVLFHTDAVQAVGTIEIDVKKWNIDLLSLSGHKFYGPKGVGALYIRNGVKIAPFVTGGHQENGRRAATENVAGIVGMAKALSLAVSAMRENTEKLERLREHTITRILHEIPDVTLNGDRRRRLPGHINFSFRFIEGESLLLMLDLAGIAASSGSACTSGSLDPSHVLLAIGLPHEIAHGSLRLTFGAENTMEEADYLVDKLKQIVRKLRDMSPLYNVK
ncbi:MAG: cysteine desulfurase NifS [Clostridia bacterium]